MSATGTDALPTTGRWAIDTLHSTASFSVRHHAVATFRAGFADIGGSYDADTDRLTGEVTVAEIALPPGLDMLKGHLQSPDFFDAVQFPTLSFTATGLQALTGGGSLSGELTMRGVTRTINVSAMVPGGVREVHHPDGSTSERFGLDLATTIDRRDYGIDFNNEIAEGIINLGWDVRIDVSLELLRPVAG